MLYNKQDFKRLFNAGGYLYYLLISENNNESQFCEVYETSEVAIIQAERYVSSLQNNTIATIKKCNIADLNVEETMKNLVDISYNDFLMIRFAFKFNKSTILKEIKSE